MLAVIDKELIRNVVMTIVSEDRELGWNVNEALLPEFELRIKQKLKASQREMFFRVVEDMLSEELIGGTWPDVWAKENRVYPIDELKKEVSRLSRQVADLEINGKQQVKVEIKEVEKFVGVQLLRGKKVVKKTTGIFHKEFPNILDLADLRMNIFLFGPTGCGKSHVCEQLAESLGLPFGFVSCTAGMSEGVIGGKLLPVGKGGAFDYVVSEFVKFYENGGVFLLDEIDAADPNVLLFINAALASEKCPVSNRIASPYAKKHEDFICIAAANTAGTNADRLYSGRNKLDASTLDRFQVGKIMMDYDIEVEKMLCPDEELLARCHVIRESLENNRLERAMSTRFIRDAYRMKTEKNWDIEKIDRAYFSGWREDEMNKVKVELKKHAAKTGKPQSTDMVSDFFAGLR